VNEREKERERESGETQACALANTPFRHVRHLLRYDVGPRFFRNGALPRQPPLPQPSLINIFVPVAVVVPRAAAAAAATIP
jgi:hypothetical protein